MSRLEDATKELRLASAVLEQSRRNLAAALRDLIMANEESRALMGAVAACQEAQTKAVGDVLAAADIARLAWVERDRE